MEINNIDIGTIDAYLNSLSVNKNWHYFENKLERANVLKNEFCGKILYGVILRVFNEYGSVVFDGISLDNKITNNDLLILHRRLVNYFSCININDVINDIITKGDSLFSDKYHDIALKLTLRIDPYSFDMLRSHNKYDPTQLELKYSKDAKKSGYLFDEETENIYYTFRFNIKKLNNELLNYIEYINNQISISKIPEEEKNNYIKAVRAIIKKYIITSSENELFKLYRALDLFLRNESEFIIQKAGTEELAKIIFDLENDDFNNNDRLLYLMYNFNRLAHDTTDISLKCDSLNYYRIDLEAKNQMNNNFTRYLKDSNVLYHFGLSLSEVYNLIDTKNYKLLFEETVSDDDKIRIINNSKLFNSSMGIIDSQTLRQVIYHLDSFKQISRQYNLTGEDEIKQIREKLLYISNQYILFFEMKNIIQEELIKKFSVKLDSNLKKFNVLDLKSLEQKQKFFAEYGFIMELQKDNNGRLLLVVYCSKFNEPFSLHLQNISQETIDNINNSGCLDNATITHCRLKEPGLTYFNDGKGYEFKDNDFVTSGGFSEFGDIGKCLLYNYLLYDVGNIKKQNNVQLTNIINSVNNGDVTLEEAKIFINRMPKFNTSKFLLTDDQKKALNIDDLLLDDSFKKIFEDFISNIEQNYEGDNYSIPISI